MIEKNGPPPETYFWLANMSPSMERYGATFVKHGFETTFAVGFIDSEEDLESMGVWKDDAKLILPYLIAPRTMVTYWSPLIRNIPTTASISVYQFFLASPVPFLSQYAERLAQNGFDSLVALKCLLAEDIGEIFLDRISVGHARTLLHMTRYIGDTHSPVLDADISLSSWLSHLKPPMHRYISAVQLLPEVESVWKLFQATKQEVMELPMPLGHRRVLWSYIVDGRTFYFDPL